MIELPGGGTTGHQIVFITIPFTDGGRDFHFRNAKVAQLYLLLWRSPVRERVWGEGGDFAQKPVTVCTSVPACVHMIKKRASGHYP